MIEILLFATLSAKQPSSPPPPPLPQRIVAVVPEELKLVKIKNEVLLKEFAENDFANPLLRKMEKIPRAKRQLNRRGNRNN